MVGSSSSNHSRRNSTPWLREQLRGNWCSRRGRFDCLHPEAMNMRSHVLRDRRNLTERFCLRNSAYAYFVRLADNEPCC